MNRVRIVAMILLFVAAIGSLLYGALFHVVAVEEEKERQISIMVPTLSGPGEAPWENHSALLYSARHEARKSHGEIRRVE